VDLLVVYNLLISDAQELSDEQSHQMRESPWKKRTMIRCTSSSSEKT